MNITVAGQDKTADLGAEVAAEAARLKASGSIGMLSPEHSALRLKESPGRDDYLRRFIDLLNMRHGVRTADYYIPRGPGLRGKVPRWARIRYTGVDPYGDPIDRSVEGFHARVVQHECDHLVGVLYPMRVRDFTQFGFTEVLFPQLGAAEDD